MLASDHAATGTNRPAILRWMSNAFGEGLEGARCLRRRLRLYPMQRLDDHMLDDIGVTREELDWAIGLPLRVNAALALHERARHRRAAAFQKSLGKLRKKDRDD